MTEKDAANILSYFRVKDDGEITQGTWYSTIKRDTEEALAIAMKALEREPRWIPVSERLPEKMGSYLVTLDYKEHGTGITTLWFLGDKGWKGWDSRVADVVVAWMPLPEPYVESEG